VRSASTSVFVYCGHLDGRELLELAPVIERLGFDGMVLSEHLVMPPASPDGHEHVSTLSPGFTLPLDVPWPDPVVMVAALAAVTTTLRFLTHVVVLPLRHPVLAAKAIGTAASVAGGRLMLGIGAGWMREEFQAVGVDFSRRGAIMDEAVDVMRALWRGGPVEHHGRFFSFGPVLMEPVPPRIPVLVGGISEAALRRAARIADGYSFPSTRVDEVRGIVERLHAALDDGGRDAREFEIVVPAFASYDDSILVTGPEQILPYVGAGATTVIAVPWRRPLVDRPDTPLPEKLERLERFAADVLAPLRAKASTVL
jgi:probable F420-dependent oxidoreductase